MSTPQSDGANPIRLTAISDILRARRVEAGLTRAELARAVSPSCQPSDIDILESHRMLMPSWIRLQQLADALEVPVTDLLPSEEEHVPDSLGSSASQTVPCTNP